jgi:hypothetical protein
MHLDQKTSELFKRLGRLLPELEHFSPVARRAVGPTLSVVQ